MDANLVFMGTRVIDIGAHVNDMSAHVNDMGLLAITIGSWFYFSACIRDRRSADRQHLRLQDTVMGLIILIECLRCIQNVDFKSHFHGYICH